MLSDGTDEEGARGTHSESDRKKLRGREREQRKPSSANVLSILQVSLEFIVALPESGMTALQSLTADGREIRFGFR